MRPKALWQKHRTSITALILLAAVILAYVIFQKAFYQKTVRKELPKVVLPKDALTLITEPDQGMAPVFDLIQNATHSIDLVMYEFQDKNIGDALIAAQARGVSVRVLVDHGYYGVPDKMNDDAYAYLAAHGITVEWTPASFALTHQKTLIVDGDTALIMTFNFTPRYYATSRDFGVLDTDRGDVDAIENTFSDDWRNKNENASLGDDLVWSPGSENDTLLIIAHAQKSLDVYNEEMQDTKVTDALSAAAQRGVSVRVVMTYATIDKAAFAELKAAGVLVRTFPESKHALYIHAKMIVADGSEAFLGSENFSAGSLNYNRELGLFISDPSIIGSLEKTFAGDYQNARVY